MNVAVAAPAPDPTGRTDSTAAFQAAINQLEAAGGGTLSIPAGTYLLSGTLSVAVGGISIQGSGITATTLNFANGAADCITVQGTSSAPLYGFELSNLAINGVDKTGGRLFYTANSAFINIRAVTTWIAYDGFEFYITNTCAMEDVLIHVEGSYGIYWHAPGDGSANSTDLTLYHVTIQASYSGASGIIVDGYATTLNAYGVALLSVSNGLVVNNSSGSDAYYPNFFVLDNFVVDGASQTAVAINAGAEFQFSNCTISNTTGASEAQGNNDEYAICIRADAEASYTRACYFSNCIVGLSKKSAVWTAAMDVTFVGCSFLAGVNTPSNTYPAVDIEAPASDVILVACKNSQFGAPNTWSYGIKAAKGTYRTLILGCNFNLGSMAGALLNQSGDPNTFLNSSIGPPSSQPGPIEQFPLYPSPPANPGPGQVYFNTTSGVAQLWNGSAWVDLSHAPVGGV